MNLRKVFEMLSKEILKNNWMHFTNVDYKEAANLGFKEKDARIFSEIGLPEFVAPNMWIHEPSVYKDGFILMGQDRDNRKIIYKDGVVYVESNDKLLLMANSLYELLEILYIYKVMIHKAGEELEDFDARNNMIPDHLILEFEEFVKTKFVNLNVDDHFWAQDIARLRSHVNDNLPKLPLESLEGWIKRAVTTLQTEEYAEIHFDRLDIDYRANLQGQELLDFSYSLAEKVFQIMKKYNAGQTTLLISIPIGEYDHIILGEEEVLKKLGKDYEPPSVYLLKNELIDNISNEEYKRPIHLVEKSGMQLISFFNSIRNDDKEYDAYVKLTCKLK